MRIHEGFEMHITCLNINVTEMYMRIVVRGKHAVSKVQILS